MAYKDTEKWREYIRKKKLEYYHKDPKKFNEKRKKYKKTKPTKEKIREYSARYYEKNKEKLVEKSRRHRKENREEFNAKQRERNRKNDPTIEIGDAFRSYARGDIGHSEYCRRVQQVVNGINEKY